MSAADSRSFEAQVLLDYISPRGATVTHMRGTLLVNSIENLRAIGQYDRYVSLLPAAHREAILYAIAASWIPIELASLHYEACDQLLLDDTQFSRLGGLTAARLAETFLSSVLRATRTAGVDAMWFALKQNDRLWDRMYQGGGVCVIQTGPKDLVLENQGLPFVGSRYWRSVYIRYLHALGSMFSRVAFVKAVHPRVPHPHRIAIGGSWV